MFASVSSEGLNDVFRGRKYTVFFLENINQADVCFLSNIMELGGTSVCSECLKNTFEKVGMISGDRNGR